MRLTPYFLPLLLLGLVFTGCEKDNPEPEGNLIFKVRLDPNQERLDAFGQPSTVPADRAAQTPSFREFSAHVIELAPNAFTVPGRGVMVYQGEETSAGGDAAVDFDRARVVAPDETIFTIPIADVPTGTYPYVRVSVTYQNYDVQYQALGQTFTGTVASFVGFNTYLTTHQVNSETVTVNDNRLQGYWAFESQSQVVSGQAPAGATTVPNPIAATSPIPLGSCLVTGEFEEALEITHTESGDVVVVLSFSVNDSFEWIDQDGNGTWDPLDGDVVVDMGLRGLRAFVE